MTFTTILVVAGVRASPGILVVPLESEFGWSRSTISLAIGISILLHGAIGPFSAALMNRYGVSRMMLYALVLIATGVSLTPFMTQSWQLVLLWGCMVGAGRRRDRERAGGDDRGALVHAASRPGHGPDAVGHRDGADAVPAAAGDDLGQSGWRMVSVTVAIAAFTLLPLVFFLMRDRPQDIGLLPLGDTEPPPPESPSKVESDRRGAGSRSPKA